MTKKLGNLFVKLDRFGTPVNLLVNGGSKFKSVCGAFMTLLIALVVLGFAYTKLMILIEKSDTNH